MNEHMAQTCKRKSVLNGKKGNDGEMVVMPNRIIAARWCSWRCQLDIPLLFLPALSIRLLRTLQT